MSETHIAYGTRPFYAILLCLFLAGFAVFSSLYCVQPMMPIFAQFFQVSPTHSSFPLSFSTIALAVGLIFSGLISDRYGRKQIMVVSLFDGYFVDSKLKISILGSFSALENIHRLSH